MRDTSKRRRRYLILPASGVTGEVMQASVFDKNSISLLNDALNEFPNKNTNLNKSSNISISSSKVNTLTEQDFKIVSHLFSDGPAVIKMTPGARRALKATNPNIRILPITSYRLPIDLHRNRNGNVNIANAVPSTAHSAHLANGAVFMQDMKQFYLDNNLGGELGKGVNIAVLDTGVDFTHQALNSSLLVSRCLIPGDQVADGGPVNWTGEHLTNSAHGTHVAGIIAARPGFGGPPGVAPEAKICSYRIFPNNNNKIKTAENDVIINSIMAAVDDGCHIINLSIEGRTLREDGVRSAILTAWENGVVCIAAAGNGYGLPVSYPAALQHCVAVSAIGKEGTYPPLPQFEDHVSDQRASSEPLIFLASFSNFGPQIQFAAPGHAIVSTFTNNEWWFNSGTSMATPFISGMLAKLLSDNSDILNMFGDENRSALTLQLLMRRAKTLGLPQFSQEGFGLPI